MKRKKDTYNALLPIIGGTEAAALFNINTGALVQARTKYTVKRTATSKEQPIVAHMVQSIKHNSRERHSIYKEYLEEAKSYKRGFIEDKVYYLSMPRDPLSLYLAEHFSALFMRVCGTPRLVWREMLFPNRYPVEYKTNTKILRYYTYEA
jgi:hypothetical protein